MSMRRGVKAKVREQGGRGERGGKREQNRDGKSERERADVNK